MGNKVLMKQAHRLARVLRRDTSKPYKECLRKAMVIRHRFFKVIDVNDVNTLKANWPYVTFQNVTSLSKKDRFVISMDYHNTLEIKPYVHVTQERNTELFTNIMNNIISQPRTNQQRYLD